MVIDKNWQQDEKGEYVIDIHCGRREGDPLKECCNNCWVNHFQEDCEFLIKKKMYKPK